MSDRQFILYDGRACNGQGTDDASVLVYCEDSKDASSYKGEYGQMACYSYALDKTTGKNEPDRLVDERHEWDYYP